MEYTGPTRRTPPPDKNRMWQEQLVTKIFSFQKVNFKVWDQCLRHSVSLYIYPLVVWTCSSLYYLPSLGSITIRYATNGTARQDNQNQSFNYSTRYPLPLGGGGNTGKVSYPRTQGTASAGIEPRTLQFQVQSLYSLDYVPQPKVRCYGKSQCIDRDDSCINFWKC